MKTLDKVPVTSHLQSDMNIHLIGGPRHAHILTRPPCVQIVFGEHASETVLHTYRRTVFQVAGRVLFHYAGCERVAPPSGIRAALLALGICNPRKVAV
jgi:hypothetical protein